MAADELQTINELYPPAARGQLRQTACVSCGQPIGITECDAVRAVKRNEHDHKCSSCEAWSDFKKQQRAWFITPRQRSKLKG